MCVKTWGHSTVHASPPSCPCDALILLHKGVRGAGSSSRQTVEHVLLNPLRSKLSQQCRVQGKYFLLSHKLGGYWRRYHPEGAVMPICRLKWVQDWRTIESRSSSSDDLFYLACKIVPVCADEIPVLTAMTVQNAVILKKDYLFFTDKRTYCISMYLFFFPCRTEEKTFRYRK